MQLPPEELLVRQRRLALGDEGETERARAYSTTSWSFEAQSTKPMEGRSWALRSAINADLSADEFAQACLSTGSHLAFRSMGPQKAM
jgi:hypothetical protein